MRSRSAARVIAARSETVGAAATSCAGTRPSPAGLARTMAAKHSAASLTVDLTSTRATRSRNEPAPLSAAAISGADSRMMPRLVLRGTACQLASTASRMRRPTARCGRQSAGAAAAALRRKSSTVMPCPSPCTCTLPGFSASISARQASRKARRKAAERGGSAASERDDMARDTIGDVDLGDALESFPGRHRIDLEHDELALGVLDEIDAAICGADGAARRHGELAEPAGNGGGLACAAACDVGDPTGAAARHRGDGDLADDEDAEIAPPVVAPDIVLEVEHAVEALRWVGQLGGAVDAAQAAPLGAEQRLCDDVAAPGGAPRSGGIDFFRHEGRRRRD